MRYLRLLPALLMLGVANGVTAAATVAFDNYISASENDYVEFFVENPSPGGPYYAQEPSGGIAGGALGAYSGPEYRATAIFGGEQFPFDSVGATVSASIFFYYDNLSLTTSRSLRLGLLNSLSCSFEDFDCPAVYEWSAYDGATGNFSVDFATANGGSTSGGGSEVKLENGHWYRLAASFSNLGNYEIAMTARLDDYGSSGLSLVSSMGSWEQTWMNAAIAQSAAAFVGLSALTDGGVQRIDNFQAAEPTRLLAELSAYACLLALGQKKREMRRSTPF